MDIKQIIFESTLYIHTMYDEPITISDIASRAYLSPSYFSFLFRNLTGYTVKNYLYRYRLFKASVDLRESDKRIVEIAFRNGFSSQQAFTKSFSQVYGISPAKFRMLSPFIEPFPPKNLWKEHILSMELIDSFNNVKFIHKNAFFVAGIEVDINYHTKGGTDPIGSAWGMWNKENLSGIIPDQMLQGVTYGITHSETAEDTGKYTVCTEVSTLDNLPVGLVGRKFDACDFAVFNTTLAIIWTGEFWRTFYAKWLPSSGYAQPDESLHKNYATFNKYPAMEVYGKDYKDDQSIIQIFAPVVKL